MIGLLLTCCVMSGYDRINLLMFIIGTYGCPDSLVKRHHCPREYGSAPHQGAIHCTPTSYLIFPIIFLGIAQKNLTVPPQQKDPALSSLAARRISLPSATDPSLRSG